MGQLEGFLGGIAERARSAATRAAATLRRREQKAPTYPATPAEQKVLGLIEEAKRVRLATLEAFEPIWTKAILFTAGIQHLRYLTTSRQFEPRKVEDWMPLPVINHCQNKVQRIVDFFTRHRPAAFVRPNSNKELDKRASELGDNVREYLWDLNGEDDNYDEAATWLVTTGNTFKRNFMDGSLMHSVQMPRYNMTMEPVVDPITGEPVLDEFGQPAAAPKYMLERDPETQQPVLDSIPMPEVNTYVCGPMAMTVPLSARKLEDAPWVMETSLQSLDVLRDLYPEKSEYIPKTGQVVTSDLYLHRVTSLLTSGLHGVVRSLDPYTLEGYGITRYYERRPTREFPRGLAVVEIDGVPLFIGDLPARDRYSWNHAGYFRVPGRFWFRGAVEDMFHPQEQINKLEQFLQLNDAHNSNPRWTVPTEAGIAEGSLKNAPGQIIRYRYPFEPKPFPGQDMPPHIVNRRMLYVEEMQEITNVRHVTMGDAPPGVTAGVALNRLGEEAEGMFSPIEGRWERFIERDQTLAMKLVQLYYSVPRFLAIRKSDGTIKEVRDFQGSQLEGNVNVKVEAGSQRPRSKAGEQQLMIDAFTLGLIPGVQMDPGQNAEFLRRMGISGFDMPEGLDFKRAKWENEMLQEDEGWEQIVRRSGDNDMIHLKVHTDARKTQDWLRLPQHVQQRHLLHEIQHLQAIIISGGMEGTDAESVEPAEESEEGGGNEQDQPEGGEGNAETQEGMEDANVE